ncbi:MAG: hypothetical protein GY940_45775, partial [bacterium]|nr:hypothetical protein [bacterium]
MNTIYPDPDGNTTWFAGADGLIRYDTKIKKNYRFDFPTLIRKVLVNGDIIFAGYKYKSKIDNKFSIKPQPGVPVIAYKDRNLRFQYAAPFFEAETKTLYRSFLEGYDNEWPGWNRETKKDYTNLDPGVYTFRVQAQNIYGNLSPEAVFQFKVLPPWYKTWWAFSGYALVSFLLVYLVVRWRSGKLVKEKQRLEQIVKERTKQVDHK